MPDQMNDLNKVISFNVDRNYSWTMVGTFVCDYELGYALLQIVKTLLNLHPTNRESCIAMLMMEIVDLFDGGTDLAECLAVYFVVDNDFGFLHRNQGSKKPRLCVECKIWAEGELLRS